MRRLSPERGEAGLHEFVRVFIDGARCSAYVLRLHRRRRLRNSRARRARAEVADPLLAQPEVKPIGLGARDTLRLEAGFASTGTTSIRPRRRSKLIWPGRSRSAAAKRRIFRARSASCANDDLGPARKRVGIRPNERAPAREGVEIYQGRQEDWRCHQRRLFADPEWRRSRWAMSKPNHADAGTPVDLMVRGQPRAADYRAAAVRAAPLLSPEESLREKPMTKRYTKDHEWVRVTAMSPLSASPPTPPSNWATSCTSSCRPTAR